MNKLRALVTMVAVAIGLAAMSGAASAQGLIKEITDRGTLRVGVAEGPPYQFPDPMTGEYIGLNIDLAKEVAAVMGVKLEVVPATWATLVTGLEVKQYDVIFANLFATPQRALTVAFTDPYDTYGFYVMVRTDSKFKTLKDVNQKGVTFAGVAGTVEASYPPELFPNASVNKLVTDQANAGPTSVLSGQSDAVLIDPGLYRIITSQNPAIVDQVRLLNGEDALLKPVSLSYAVRQGDWDMLGFLNVFIRDKVANGAIVRARNKWFDKMAQR